MREQTESVGIALEAGEIGPLPRREARLQLTARALAEEARNGLLAAVAEGRIAKIVGQTCGRHYLAEGVETVNPRFGGILAAQRKRDLARERPPHTRYFEAVGKPVVNEYASRQWKHLRLVLQPPERRREYQTVIIAQKVAAHPGLRVVIRLEAEALVANKPVPLHKPEAVTNRFVEKILCHTPKIFISLQTDKR